MQRELNDCWVVAAIIDFGMRPELFYRVCPPDQSFLGEEYFGIFHFQFWQYGDWIDVVIDDLIPCHNGKPIYMRLNGNLFWMILLEKAYAK